MGLTGPCPKRSCRCTLTPPLIQRHGEVNAWDNAEFRAAVEATVKKQVVLAGIVTDVCEFTFSSYCSILPHLSLHFRASISRSLTTSLFIKTGTTFLALSLRAQGYSVWANVEASGTINELIRSTANDQMRHAGVQVVSLFAIIADLMRTWAQAPPGTLEFFGTYLPVSSMSGEIR